MRSGFENIRNITQKRTYGLTVQILQKYCVWNILVEIIEKYNVLHLKYDKRRKRSLWDITDKYDSLNNAPHILMLNSFIQADMV